MVYSDLSVCPCLHEMVGRLNIRSNAVSSDGHGLDMITNIS